MINNMMESIFSSKAKVKLLRFLSVYDPEMSGRELARNVGLSHVQALKVLDEFAKDGLVSRKRVGNTFSFRINNHNLIVKGIINELFKKEESISKKMLLEIADNIAPDAVSVYLFGSMAYGKQRPGSDIDLFFIVKDEKSRKKAEKRAVENYIDSLKETGKKVSALVVSLAGYRKMKSEKKQILNNINQGVLVKGEEISRIR